MNEKRANDMLDELRGRHIGGWQVQRLIRHGKSAVVFQASKSDHICALKVFDPELVERYGELTQLTRIERELSLRNKTHKHLIQIYDGGKCEKTQYLYIVMQCVSGNPLSCMLGKLPRDQIRSIIEKIANAAKFLEEHEIAHRDIKPDNIVFSPDTGKTTLLDLGVLRPINSSSNATDDDDSRPFIGTLQYSPPEFLLRNEEDTIEGWRAVTFYQLGAVLHDLIECRPIFENEKEPYARLVNAVLNTPPSFDAADVPDLSRLAQNCLVKVPDLRLRLVNWQDFQQKTRRVSPGVAARQRIQNRYSTIDLANSNHQERWNLSQNLQRSTAKLKSLLRQWRINQRDILPPIEIRDHASTNSSTSVLGLHFRPDSSRGLRHHLLIRLEVELLDNDNDIIEIRTSTIISESVQFPGEGQTLPIYRGSIGQDDIDSTFMDLVFPVFDLAIGEQPPLGRVDLKSFIEWEEDQ